MADRRGFAVVAGGGVAASALAAVAAAQPWVDVNAALSSLGAAAVGSTLQPYAQSPTALALALVALAAWGVLLVVRGRARTVMAVLGLVFAAGLLVVTVVGYRAVPDGVRQAMVDQFGTPRRATAALHLPHTAWYWLEMVSSAATVVALVLAARRARHWPAMGARYDAPGGVRAGEQDMWRTLDEGGDPTDPGSA